MQKSVYSSKRVQDFPEIDVESSCLGFGPPVLAVVGWISSGIPPIITLNRVMMMMFMMMMAMRMGWDRQCSSLILHQTAWHPP